MKKTRPSISVHRLTFPQIKLENVLGIWKKKKTSISSIHELQHLKKFYMLEKNSGLRKSFLPILTRMFLVVYLYVFFKLQPLMSFGPLTNKKTLKDISYIFHIPKKIIWSQQRSLHNFKRQNSLVKKLLLKLLVIKQFAQNDGFWSKKRVSSLWQSWKLWFSHWD